MSLETLSHVLKKWDAARAINKGGSHQKFFYREVPKNYLQFTFKPLKNIFMGLPIVLNLYIGKWLPHKLCSRSFARNMCYISFFFNFLVIQMGTDIWVTPCGIHGLRVPTLWHFVTL